MQSRQSCEWCSSGIALNCHDAPSSCFLAVFFKRHGDCPIKLATTVLGLIKSLSRLPSLFMSRCPLLSTTRQAFRARSPTCSSGQPSHMASRNVMKLVQGASLWQRKQCQWDCATTRGRVSAKERILHHIDMHLVACNHICQFSDRYQCSWITNSLLSGTLSSHTLFNTSLVQL